MGVAISREGPWGFSASSQNVQHALMRILESPRRKAASGKGVAPSEPLWRHHLEYRKHDVVWVVRVVESERERVLACCYDSKILHA